MASNAPRSGKKARSNHETASTNQRPQKKPQKKKVVEKHPFAEPWEDSDLILVVEKEKFHVHRQILSIHSPVFKAMLNSQFKETTAKEIPLPGKKANEILDFLKQLYLKEGEGLALNKVGHLLKLADEYQVKAVLDLCVKCLKDELKSEENAVKILFLANHTVIAREDCRLDGVREQCYDLIKDMELAKIQGRTDYRNLDRESLESVLVERNKRLETFLKEIYPQFIGLVECCLWACMEKDTSHTHITPCPQHFSGNRASEDLLKRINSCSVCRRMILQLVSFSQCRLRLFSAAGSSVGNPNYKYGGSCHFENQLITIIQDFENIFNL